MGQGEAPWKNPLKIQVTSGLTLVCTCHLSPRKNISSQPPTLEAISPSSVPYLATGLDSEEIRKVYIKRQLTIVWLLVVNLRR